jgi:hypothetical protein
LRTTQLRHVTPIQQLAANLASVLTSVKPERREELNINLLIDNGLPSNG